MPYSEHYGDLYLFLPVTLTGNVTSVTTQELQGSVNFFCIPSDDRVQVQWQFFQTGSLEPVVVFSPGVGFLSPNLQVSPSGRTVTLSTPIASNAGVYRCSVAGDTGLLVSPLDVNITVLRSKLFSLIVYISASFFLHKLLASVLC